MHGLILGGWFENNEVYFSAFLEKSNFVTSIKRSAGAHRIATYLRTEGWDIEVVDFLPAWTIEEFKELCKSRITKDTVFVGYSCLFNMFLADKINPFLDWLKQEYPHVILIAGSKHLITSWNLNCDYYLAGYGEYGLSELLKKITGKPSTIEIQEMFPMGKHIKYVNCDEKHPAFPCKDLRVKYEERDYIQPNEILTLELSRGCRFECKFCSFNVLGVKGDYTVDAELLKEEILYNYKQWGTTAYSLADETINDSTSKLEKVAKVCQSLPFEITLTGYVRADLVVSRGEKDWIPMVDMGLWGHFYGIESFNHDSAKYIKKGMHPDKLKSGLIDAKSFFMNKLNKYSSHISLIVGLPYETKESFYEGVNWLNINFNDSRIHLPVLKIQNELVGSPFKNKYSEFDRTWQDDNIFTEMTTEEIENKLLKYPIEWRDTMRQDIMGSNTFLKWKHCDMDVVDAAGIAMDLEHKEDFILKQVPSMWMYHQYITSGRFTLDDMTKTRGELRDLNDCYAEPDMSKQFFADYKRKKLSTNSNKSLSRRI